ncbi:U1 small nuclear ribonucleoprotein 70 kDa-like [Prorops nasuta]
MERERSGKERERVKEKIFGGKREGEKRRDRRERVGERNGEEERRNRRRGGEERREEERKRNRDCVLECSRSGKQGRGFLEKNRKVGYSMHGGNVDGRERVEGSEQESTERIQMVEAVGKEGGEEGKGEGRNIDRGKGGVRGKGRRRGGEA